MPLPPLGADKTLSLMLTYQCTAKCRNCGTLSNPKSRVHLEESLALQAIRDAARLGFAVVVFTGGEPLIRRDILLNCIELSRSLGVPTRVVTNAYWGSSLEEARSVITELRAAGLGEINFSTGSEHSRFVPVDSVLNAAFAAAEANLVVAIMLEVTAGATLTKSTLIDQPSFKRLRLKFPAADKWIIESPWMPLSPKSAQAYPQGYSINSSNVTTRVGCDSILSTATVQPDGRIGACCGLGMRLIPELQVGTIADGLEDAMNTAEDDFLKRWLRVDGPEKILAWAASRNTELRWEDMYAHRCQACLRIYKDPAVRETIRRLHAEAIPDVVMAEYLLFHHETEIDPSTSHHARHLPVVD